MKIQGKDIAWRKYKRFLIPVLPPHIDIELTKDEARVLLRKYRALFLRYVSDWSVDCHTKQGGFYYVIKDGFLGLDELSAKTRRKVRRGNKNCLVKKVDVAEIIKHGYEVYVRAFARYKGVTPVSKAVFIERYKNRGDRDFFVVYNRDNKMIAYSENIISCNVAEYYLMRLDPDYLRLYISYALIYEMNRYYLAERGMKYVNAGSVSVLHDTNIQEFLISKFKFKKAYVKLHIVYNPLVGLMIKLLFPLRRFLYHCQYSYIKKICAVLKYEEMRWKE